MSPTERRLEMLAVLQARPGITAAALAERFAVSERTARRDDDEGPSCVLILGTDDLDWAAHYLVYLNLDFNVLAPNRAELESQLDLDQLGVALHRPAPTGPHEAVADVGVVRRRVAGGHVDH